MQQDIHSFSGMRRDLHPISQDAKFLWDAKNIRITARESDTLLSITNEKGTTKHVPLLLEGYCGHAVIGDWVVIFATGLGKSVIYRIGLDSYTWEKGECHIEGEDVPIEVCEMKRVPTIDILYIGDLGFDKAHPIQTVTDYESKLIQKVYWTDGIHQPRVINAAYPELILNNTTRLNTIIEDFGDKTERDALFTDNGINLYQSIWNKALTQEQRNDIIAEENISGTPSRYRRAYYDYTSLFKRGNEQFDFVPTLNLKESIDISRIDGSGLFPSGVIQYCITYYDKYGQESNIAYTTGLYNISSSEHGGDPEKRVSCTFKIKINDIDTRFDYLRIYSIIRTTKDSVPTIKRVIDIPITNNTIEYTDDGTNGDVVDPTSLLFKGGETITAGTIAAKDNTLFLGDISVIKPTIKDINFNIPKYGDTSNIKVKDNEGNPLYIKRTKGSFSGGFKSGDTYRLGLQFQYKDGSWTEPVFIGDKQMPSNFRIHPSKGTPVFRYILDSQLKEYLLEREFKRVRPLIVLPDNTNRSVIAQGIVCPTVFKVNSRKNNNPSSQSSWLLRLFSHKNPLFIKYNPEIGFITTDRFIQDTYIPEFRHLMPLAGGLNKNAEIQSMVKSSFNILPTYKEVMEEVENPFMSNMYFVDQSVLTLHSPDIEFNEALYPLFESESNLKVRLIGIAKFNSSYGNIDITTSSPTIGILGSGITTSPFNGYGAETLTSGLMYTDEAADPTKDKTAVESGGVVAKWMTYLWHRSGSLNNDFTRGTYPGTRSALLRKKIVSNIKFSNETTAISPIDVDIQDLQLFNSNELSLIKLRDGDDYITYYGNVDQLLTVPEYSITVNASKTLKAESVNNIIVDIYPEGSNSKLNSSEITLSLSNPVRHSFSKTIIATVNNNVSIKDLSGSNINLKNSRVLFQVNLKDTSDTTVYSGYLMTTYNKLFIIKGTKTSFGVSLASKSEAEDGPIAYLDSMTAFGYLLNYNEEDYNAGALSGKDTIRIKYKSTPHLVFNTSDKVPIISPTEQVVAVDTIKGFITPEVFENDDTHASLWVAEVYRDNPDNNIEAVNDSNVHKYTRFGGLSDEALKNNLWIPANLPISLSDDSCTVDWLWGDTWYQRYDCLKTYPFTEEDENQIVEIGCSWCETRVNLEGRYDRNIDLHDNNNIRPTNFNKVNTVYSQSNNFFSYRILDNDYYKLKTYPSQIVWSLVKSPADINDIWTSIRSSSQLDLPSTLGRINKVVPWNESLLGFQDKGIVNILFNSRVQIQVSDGVPIEIANSQRIEGFRVVSDIIGCQSPFACTTTPNGIYFVDMNTFSFYRFGESFENLGDINGFTIPLKELLKPRELNWMYTNESKGIKNGIRIDYDPTYGDIYLTPGYSLWEETLEPDETVTGKYEADLSYVYSEKLGQFISRVNYGGSILIPYKGTLYAIALEHGTQENWIWTMFTGKYNNIFNGIKSYEISFISNSNPLITKIFDTIDIEADLFKSDISNLIEGNINHDNITFLFNYIRVSNEYQDTNIVPFNTYNLRKKFRLWRATIPRQYKSRNRIRNQWSKVTLGKLKPKEDEMMVLHNIVVNYSI